MQTIFMLFIGYMEPCTDIETNSIERKYLKKGDIKWTKYLFHFK